MAEIRLARICRRFNTGVREIVTFLNQNGANLEFNPNAKVDSAYLPLLTAEFGQSEDKSVSLGGSILSQLRSSRYPKQMQIEREINKIASGFEAEHPELIPPKPLSKWEQLEISYKNNEVLKGIVSDSNKGGLLVWVNDVRCFLPGSHIDVKRVDDNDTFINQTIECKIIEFVKDNKCVVSRKIVLQEKQRAQEKKERFDKGIISNAPKRSDKILSSTRVAGAMPAAEIQREVWEKFIEIQEKIIRQNSAPISILANSVKLTYDNSKLSVTIDETASENRVCSILRDRLGIESYDINSGELFVDERIWDGLSYDSRKEIARQLAENYVDLDIYPTIDVKVDYATELGNTDLQTLDELRAIDAKYGNNPLLSCKIDDTAAFVSKIEIDIPGILKELFGGHHIHTAKKNTDVILYRNHYLSESMLEEYRKMLGIRLSSYNIVCYIENEWAREQVRDCFDCYYPNTKTFEFRRSFSRDEMFKEEVLVEINDNITVLLEEIKPYCREDQVRIDCDFTYTISREAIVNYKKNELENFIYTSDRVGLSYNKSSGVFGADIKWRTENIDDVIRPIEDSIKHVKVKVYADHRLKCKVETSMRSLDSFLTQLKAYYENISIDVDEQSHSLTIRIPDNGSDVYNQQVASLHHSLVPLESMGLNLEFSGHVDGKIRLKVSDNHEERVKNLEDVIEDMKRVDFGIEIGEKEIKFGKLLSANYPKLVFDIDPAEKEEALVIAAFENHTVHQVVPILTGDLEKISRLKNTFTMATSGQNLYNENLQRFIFDSSFAQKIDDVELYLRRDGGPYLDMERNLLNSTVNESQKDSIIKAIAAKDMAVIQGPPGTGKSTAIAEMLWQMVRNGFKPSNTKERILLTSETNLAVDNAISRIVNDRTNLVKPIRFGGEEKLESEGMQFSLDLMKKWVAEGDDVLVDSDDNGGRVEYDLILKNWLSNISSRSFYSSTGEDNEIITRWRRYLGNPDQDLRSIMFENYKNGCNVVGATCSSIGDKRSTTGYTQFFRNYCEVFNYKNASKTKIEFTTVIQDESSKATPAELVLPFVYGHKAIVIGDHRQLPPMLDKEEFEDTLEYALSTTKDPAEKEHLNELKAYVEAHFAEMEISHFQKLYEHIDASLKSSFTLQYRMHPDINQVIEQFYVNDGGLKCGLQHPKDLGVDDPDISNKFSRYHGINIEGLITPDTHVLFIDSNSPELKDGNSRVNYGEAETIDRLLTKFEESESFHEYLSHFSSIEDKQIGVISFYGKQIKQLRSVAYKHKIPIRVSTVDRFQGMERNIIIVSMVRSDVIQTVKGEQPDYARYKKGYPEQKSLGFAQSPNRLNVALSRARRLLIIVGNRGHFSRAEIYRKLFQVIEDNSFGNTKNVVLSQEEI